jgi:hypothetical protein
LTLKLSHAIARREVHDALDRLLAEGKGYTANRIYEALRTFFKWLYQRDRLPVKILWTRSTNPSMGRKLDNELGPMKS